MIKKHKALFICLPIVILLTILAVVGYFGCERKKNIESLLKDGNRYMSKYYYEQAIAVYRQTLDIDDKNLEARLSIAECYTAQGKTEYAIEEYKTAIEYSPRAATPYVKLAELYIGEDRLSDAKEIIEKASERIKNDDDISELYTISHPTPPESDVASGSYSERKIVSLSASDRNKIYYTLDGSAPSASSESYDSRIILKNGDTKLCAVACNTAGFYSDIAEFDYSIEIADVVIEFEDEAVEDAVREITTDRSSEDIMNDDIEQITELYIIGNMLYYGELHEEITFSGNACYIGSAKRDITRSGKVKSLADIEKMSNLETLVVAYQAELDLSDFKAPASLKRLSLISDGITSDSLKYISAIDSLEELCLGWNDIDDISELEKLTSLKSLALWGNSISDISAVERLDKLEYLDLSDNKVVDISAVAKLTSLEELWIYRNSIKQIEPIKKLSSLTVLMLSDNPISDPESIRAIYPQLKRIDEDLLGLGSKEK